ncbi:minor capsid protein [uncultured Faecalibaculum sp.]|uniref:minor capsid protein n=1 Tax=uncultured Faecalibaculum sp. TaxID=1729681 RepID=UPI0025DF5E04|nr:minor capsid protein [uncultured Faecalibaculum sp.]
MSSADYWKKREQEWLKECEKEEKGWSEELYQIYQNLGDEIEEQINLFISRFGEGRQLDITEARKYLDSTDIEFYARRAEYYCRMAALDMEAGTTDRAKEYFSEQANEEMARYNATMKINRLRMLQSQMNLRILNAQCKTESVLEAALTERTVEEFERQAGILGDTVLNNVQNAEVIANAPFHGATFSKRIWGTQQDQLQKQMTKLMTDGLVLGKNPRVLARDLRKVINVAPKQAERLMRTELNRCQIEADRASYKSAGLNQYTFIANSGCCHHCQDLDGEHFDLEDMQSGKTAPPMHPNCRCSTAGYMKREDDGITDEDVDLFDKWSETFEEHGLTWEEWKNLDGFDHNRIQKDRYIHEDKIKKFLLKPGAKHAQEFFDVGYTENDWKQLETDILSQYTNASYDRSKGNYGQRFSITMDLGIDKKRPFQVVWGEDGDRFKLVTAHRIPVGG